MPDFSRLENRHPVEATLEMIQMYLGFLVRKFVAEKKSKEEGS